MQRKSHQGVAWLEFDLFLKYTQLQHGTFLRHGGFSRGPFSSLNLCYAVGDDPDDVTRNIQVVTDQLQLSCLVRCRQVHGTHVHAVTKMGSYTVLGCDALMTDIPDIGLLIQHADCQAAIIYDPVNHAIVNVHAGWRGNVLGIYEKVIAQMKKHYGSLPENLLVGISPSLGPDASQFINYKTEFPESFWRFQHKPLYFDLWAIAQMQLEEAGIRPENIEIARQCTFSNPQDFYSHRYSKIRGLHSTIVRLR
jgi:YfiH family protein